jgi:hypothetical protein
VPIRFSSELWFLNTEVCFIFYLFLASDRSWILDPCRPLIHPSFIKAPGIDIWMKLRRTRRVTEDMPTYAFCEDVGRDSVCLDEVGVASGSGSGSTARRGTGCVSSARETLGGKGRWRTLKAWSSPGYFLKPAFLSGTVPCNPTYLPTYPPTDEIRSPSPSHPKPSRFHSIARSRFHLKHRDSLTRQLG